MNGAEHKLVINSQPRTSEKYHKIWGFVLEMPHMELYPTLFDGAEMGLHMELDVYLCLDARTSL